MVAFLGASFIKTCTQGMRSISAPLQTLTVFVVIKISKCSEKARWQTLLKDGLRRPNQVFTITQGELVRLICESSVDLINSLQLEHKSPIFCAQVKMDLSKASPQCKL